MRSYERSGVTIERCSECGELRNALLAYYAAHGALHAKLAELRERADRGRRLH